MALFKVFHGDEADLNDVQPHEGYAYFCEDTGNFFVDVSSTPGGRMQLNAYAARVLLDANGDEISFTTLDNGALAVGGTNGTISSLVGTGVLKASVSGQPEFGVAPIEYGGTGATSAAEARDATHLDVYSRQETKDAVGTKAYETMLFASAWLGNDTDGYEQSYANTDLRCGLDGKVPPIVTYVENLDDWLKVDSADATPGVEIVFKAKEKPTNDIKIIVVDNA